MCEREMEILKMLNKNKDEWMIDDYDDADRLSNRPIWWNNNSKKKNENHNLFCLNKIKLV